MLRLSRRPLRVQGATTVDYPGSRSSGACHGGLPNEPQDNYEGAEAQQAVADNQGGPRGAIVAVAPLRYVAHRDGGDREERHEEEGPTECHLEGGRRLPTEQA